MDVGKLLERIIAQNEIIIRQNEKFFTASGCARKQERCGTTRGTEKNQSPRLTRDERSHPETPNWHHPHFECPLPFLTGPQSPTLLSRAPFEFPSTVCDPAGLRLKIILLASSQATVVASDQRLFFP
jgi:hypothetical protein